MSKPRIRRSEFQNLRRCGSWLNDDSELAAFGSAVHEAIAAWIKCCQAEGRTVPPVAAMVPHHDPDALALLETFTATHDANLSTIYGAEVALEVELDDVILTGTLDRLDMWETNETWDALVSDWKTGWHVGDHTYQQRWYGALVVHRWPKVQKLTMRVDNIRLGANGVTEETMSRAELLEWWDAEVVAYIPDVLRSRANGGEPRGGAACQYCKRRKDCANSIAPYRDAPSDDAEAQVMLSDLVRLQVATKAREDALRLYLEERSPLESNGMVAGFSLTKESVTVDTKAARAAGLVKVSPPAPRWGIKKSA